MPVRVHSVVPLPGYLRFGDSTGRGSLERRANAPQIEEVTNEAVQATSRWHTLFPPHAVSPRTPHRQCGPLPVFGGGLSDEVGGVVEIGAARFRLELCGAERMCTTSAAAFSVTIWVKFRSIEFQGVRRVEAITWDWTSFRHMAQGTGCALMARVGLLRRRVPSDEGTAGWQKWLESGL